MDSIHLKKAQAKRLDAKTGSNILLFTRNIPQSQRQKLPQSKELGKDFQSNGPKKQVGVAVLISSKIKRDGKGHFILITGTIH